MHTMLPRLLTADEVSGWLNIPRSTIYAWAKAGTLPSIRLGALVRFDSEAIKTWMAQPPK